MCSQSLVETYICIHMLMHICLSTWCMYMLMLIHVICIKSLVHTPNPTWGDIFECCFKAQSSKRERLFSLKRGKRDVRALSFELSKLSPQVGLAVHTYVDAYMMQHMLMHICLSTWCIHMLIDVICSKWLVHGHICRYTSRVSSRLSMCIHTYVDTYMYIYMLIHIHVCWMIHVCVWTYRSDWIQVTCWYIYVDIYVST